MEFGWRTSSFWLVNWLDVRRLRQYNCWLQLIKVPVEVRPNEINSFKYSLCLYLSSGKLSKQTNLFFYQLERYRVGLYCKIQSTGVRQHVYSQQKSNHLRSGFLF